MKIHNVEQGTPEWHALRCGLITASEVKLLMTPTLKPANNDKSRSHLYELAAQRISKYVEPRYISSDMLRGHEDEVRARILYEEHTGRSVQEVGFITNTLGDVTPVPLGFSPDGLVGDDGMIECKSRCQKYQVQTALDGLVPEEFILQIQTGLLITGREWCDFLSYSGGLPMIIYRVHSDRDMQDRIFDALRSAESKINDIVDQWNDATKANGWPSTERATESEDGGYKWEVEED